MNEIPKIDFPGDGVGRDYLDENLVNLEDYFGDRIFIEPVYYNMGIPDAIQGCFVRRGVATLLDEALKSLPGNITFKVFDAWRPQSVQKSLYNSFFKEIADKNSEWTISEVESETIKFVSKPVYDDINPAVHSTGGAIDLTLAYKDSGISLPMGTEFDDFSEMANTCYFEDTNNEQIKYNRRLLYWTMINAGFTNLPTEWWHYDYGTRFWSYYTKEPAKYGLYTKTKG